MTSPRSLVVGVSDFGTRGPGSIPGWAPITHCLRCLLFSVIMILNVLIELSPQYVEWASER